MRYMMLVISREGQAVSQALMEAMEPPIEKEMKSGASAMGAPSAI